MLAGNPSALAVHTPAANEYTIATYNLQRFFDNIDEPGIGDPVLTATAYSNRLNKASLAIRNFLLMPDILGVVEVENLTTLQTLATKINNDAVAAGQPNPNYVAYLTEGNDPGGIDVGFLVKGPSRVNVLSVTQVGKTDTYINPNTSLPETLNDRPPLVLKAEVIAATGVRAPVTVIVNHLRSLNGVDDPTDGRVRAKRRAQAEFLANYVQGLQMADPNEKIVLVGDFNAYQFNDGFVDLINTILGTPTPASNVVLASADLVNPNLLNLVNLLSTSNTDLRRQPYSYVFDGSAQVLDHILISQNLQSANSGFEYARLSADYPETFRNDPNRPERLSDHDAPVAYFTFPITANLLITKTDSPDPVLAGNNITYSITVTNNGPDTATNVVMSDTLPTGTTFVSMSGSASTVLSTPSVGATGTVTSTLASLPVGGMMTVTLVVKVDPTVASGTVINNTATVSSATNDNDTTNNRAMASTNVETSADLSVTKLDTPDPVIAGNNLTYIITLNNAGPSNAAAVTLADALPPATTFVSLSSPMGWNCTTPPAGSNGAISCTNPSLGLGNAVFTLTVNVGAGVANGTTLTNNAIASSTTNDSSPGNNLGQATTTVNASANLAITKTNNVTMVAAGSQITYTITASNAGPSNAPNVKVMDAMPASLSNVTWTCVGAVGGSCGSPGSGDINATVNLPAGGSVTYTVQGTLAANATGVLSNTAMVTPPGTVADPNNNNNTAEDRDTILNPANVSGTKTVSGSFTPGSTITYTITLTNNSNSQQLNNPGDEFTDVLPAGLTLVSAAASSGVAATNIGTRIVTWNGAIPANGSVTITIRATINPLANGTVLSNQGQIAYDADGDGTNEAARVTDDPSIVGPANPTDFAVTVIPFRVQISDPLVCTGDSNTLTVHAEVTNPNNAAGTFNFQATLPPQLSGVANTCVITGGTCTVNAGDVIASGPIAANQTISIDYKVRVTPGTPPGTNLCVDSTVTLNARQVAGVQACTVLNCPAANQIVNAQVSDQKAGSVLVFPYYTSRLADRRDTLLTISNIGSQFANVHIFFMEGASCSPADMFLCLTPNASFSMKASEYTPEETGYVIAVAVNAEGIPVQNNSLIGNAFVMDGDYVGNYGAESFAAHSRALAAVEGGTATLFFDGSSYDGVPSQLAAEIQSPVDAVGQRIVTAGLSGDLTRVVMRGAAQVGVGIAVNGSERPFGSFSAFLLGNCQSLATISISNPRVPNGMGQTIPTGQTGTIRFNVGGAVGLLMTPRTASYKGIRTLHKTALTTATLTMPVIRPVC
ncbi:MAG TPA: endonuclease/exonuclease/phosphatase family protein [Blastocatellia bacterium]|nr:endonuclease/exonuclease/phosphatase family protein [Blastocatellia bacterium]